jgi:hypothetical protein
MTAQKIYPVTSTTDPNWPATRAVALEMAGGDRRRLVDMLDGSVIIANHPAAAARWDTSPRGAQTPRRRPGP